MSKSIEINVKSADLPQVKVALEHAASEIKRLTAERDEWEERYEDLLSRGGGTAP